MTEYTIECYRGTRVSTSTVCSYVHTAEIVTSGAFKSLP
jgi:hypothetical protein